MKIYPELAKIVELNAEIKRLCEALSKKLDCDGLDVGRAYFVDECFESRGHLYHGGGKLDNSGKVDNDYYCDQYKGYLGDDFHGTCYFATDKKGVFVAVPFDM